MSSALVLAASGSEEMELVIIVDVLRRAGIKVQIVSIDDTEQVTCARGTVIKVDEKLTNVTWSGEQFDAVVLPGGQPGSTNLAESNLVGAVLKQYEKDDKLIAAICAAPIALRAHKIAPGATITSYPSVRAVLEDGGYKYSEKDVEVCGKLVTSKGPGTAMQFALKLVELLNGKEIRDGVAGAMLVQ